MNCNKKEYDPDTNCIRCSRRNGKRVTVFCPNCGVEIQECTPFPRKGSKLLQMSFKCYSCGTGFLCEVKPLLKKLKEKEGECE